MVPTRSSVDVGVVTGLAFVLGWGVLALRNRTLAFSWLWFFGALAPVSQFIAPLQNRMADRYVWLSVASPCMLVGWGVAHIEERYRLAARASTAALVLALGVTAFDRSTTFSDSVLLFADGTAKTRTGTRAPYQLGCALEALGREEAAMIAYREVLARSRAHRDEDVRRSINNLARLLWRRGATAETEALLRKGLTQFADDPKMRGNLAKVLRATGRVAEADAIDPRRGDDL